MCEIQGIPEGSACLIKECVVVVELCTLYQDLVVLLLVSWLEGLQASVQAWIYDCLHAADPALKVFFKLIG